MNCSCGASIEQQGVVCEMCRGMTSAPLETETSSSSHASLVDSDGNSRSRPPRRERKSTAEIRRLYRETLGGTELEEFLSVFTSPMIIGLLAVAVWLLIALAIFVVAPNLELGWALFAAAVLSVSMAYYGTYCKILMGLYYTDRIAFVYSLLALVGVPFVSMMYLEEIGRKNVFFALGCYVFVVAGTVIALLAANEVPAELLEVLSVAS